MAESLTKKVEGRLFTATDYVAAANTLMEVVNDFVKQGDLASATKSLEQVNLLLGRANSTIEEMKTLV